MSIVDRIKNFFSNETPNQVTVDDPLLQALLNNEVITRDKALTVPAVSSAVDLISSMIASTPVKLYKYKGDKLEEVKGDTRTSLLNRDTGDTLDAYQMKKAMVTDYLLGKGGYAFIRHARNEIVGLYYVKDINVQPLENVDPIYKYVNFIIGTKTYKNYELVKLLRNTKNGASGKGTLEEVSKLLETAFSTLVYQLGLVKTGGNKKGFLLAEKKIGAEEIAALKTAWHNLYGNSTENIVILNNGLKFQESSNSSVEMQLNQSKKTLTDDINSVFHITPNDFNKTFKEAIYPIIKAFENALNSTLLLEREKGKMFFEFDVKELIRANAKDEAETLEKYDKMGVLTKNEIRRLLNRNSIEGLDVINIGLGSVLYDVNTQTYYTPNTNEVFTGNEDKGGNEDGVQVPEESNQE